MSHELSSIHEICTALTTELTVTPMSDFEAHARFRRLLLENHLDYDTYLRTSVTSCAYRRNPTLESRDVIAQNTDAALLAQQWLGLTGEIDASRSWNGASMGYVPHFNQNNYLTFCYLGIMRPDERRLSTIERRFHYLTETAINLTLMNSREPNAVRKPEYVKFTDVFYESLADIDCRPVDRIIGLFDSNVSLGGSREAHLADIADIDSSTASFSSQHISKLATQLIQLNTHATQLRELGVPEAQ